jgi:hypothetical protein
MKASWWLAAALVAALALGGCEDNLDSTLLLPDFARTPPDLSAVVDAAPPDAPIPPDGAGGG